jgi:hypothetical protein
MEEIMRYRTKWDRRSKRRSVLVVALAAVSVGACDGIFEVENPNQLVDGDLDRPEAATALVNGAEASLARALSRIVLPISVASDELKSIGSLDYGRELDQGTLSNPSNEVTNTAFPYVAEARFVADDAIRRLAAFESEGRLPKRADLARAYLYGGIVYTYIADAYDDFVISDRREASPPIGEQEMDTLYDRAIEYLSVGLSVARASNAPELELALLAQRARSRHARALWSTLNANGGDPARPIVAGAEAAADAEAALALIPSPDWKFQLRYSAGTVASALGAQVNVRQEYRVGDEYAIPTADGKRVESIRLLDPIDGIPDPAVTGAVGEFVAGGQYPPLTVVSARELYLILAEVALAEARDPDAERWINAVRDLDGLTPAAGQLPLRELLEHERRVSLFLQGRRLADHYRFGVVDAAWQAGSDAVQQPGTFFPIAEIERLSNCHLTRDCG